MRAMSNSADENYAVGRLRRFLGVALLGGCLAVGGVGGGSLLAQDSLASKEALVEFFSPVGEPCEFIIPQSGSLVPTSKVNLSFGRGDSARLLDLDPVDPAKLYVGYARVTLNDGGVKVFPSYAVGNSGQWDSILELVKDGTGVDGKLTFKFFTGSDFFTAGVVARDPMTSFRVPAKYGPVDGTAVGLVCGSDAGCNVSMTFFDQKGLVFDRVLTRVEANHYDDFYFFEIFKNGLPEYGNVDVVSDGDMYVMAIDQHRHSFTVAPVYGGVGLANVPGLKLADLLEGFSDGVTGLGSGDVLAGSPRLAGGRVTYTNVNDPKVSFSYGVNDYGLVSLVPEGFSGPVFLPDGRYERVVSVDGFVPVKRIVRMPDGYEVVPLVDKSRWVPELAKLQWTGGDSGLVNTNFFADLDKVYTCYLNTSGMNFVYNTMDKAIRDGFRHWVKYVLPGEGIRTEYVESDMTPLPDINLSNPAKALPDHSFVVYKSDRQTGGTLLGGSFDPDSFTVRNIFVEWRQGAGALGLASEYPALFGKEDSDVTENMLNGWGLKSWETILVDHSSYPQMFPTPYDVQDNKIKRVFHKIAPGTRIISDDSGHYLRMPEKK